LPFADLLFNFSFRTDFTHLESQGHIIQEVFQCQQLQLASLPNSEGNAK